MSLSQPIVDLETRPEIQGLLDRFTVSLECDCQVWDGPHGANGYPLLKWGVWWKYGVNVRQLLYEIAYRKEVPQGCAVYNWCQTFACINPAHLFLLEKNHGRQVSRMRNDGELLPRIVNGVLTCVTIAARRAKTAVKKAPQKVTVAVRKAAMAMGFAGFDDYPEPQYNEEGDYIASEGYGDVRWVEQPMPAALTPEEAVAHFRRLDAEGLIGGKPVLVRGPDGQQDLLSQHRWRKGDLPLCVKEAL